jgi:hypothetical protein
VRKHLIQFTVRCHPRYRFTFKVSIFRSQRDLDRYRRETSGVGSCLAYCNGYKIIDYRRGQRGVKSPEIGELAFSYPQFRMGIICHEAVHAGVQFMKAARKPMNFDVPVNRTRCNKNEELFAWVVGNIAIQIVLRTQKLQEPK